MSEREREKERERERVRTKESSKCDRVIMVISREGYDVQGEPSDHGLCLGLH